MSKVEKTLENINNRSYPNLYVAIDTEHGGFIPSPTLLESYFGIYNDKWELIDQVLLKTKPDNGVYRVSAQALEVNKIDIIQHDKEAVSFKEAGGSLYGLLDEHSQGGKYKLIPVGHNVPGDIMLINEHILNHGAWTKHVSYRVLDTGSVGQYLRAKGIIPQDIKGSLGALCEFFNVPLLNAHTAKADGDASAMLMKAMLEMT